MTHYASDKFWALYDALPGELRKAANESFTLLKSNSSHRSLDFKPVGFFWSARISGGYRVLARRKGEDVYWFWIGPHDEYERLIYRRR